MIENKAYPFTSKVSIHGTGNCVIIPKKVMKCLELKKDDIVTLTMIAVGFTDPPIIKNSSRSQRNKVSEEQIKEAQTERSRDKYGTEEK